MNNQKSQVNNKKRNQKRKTINDIDSCFTIKTIIIATEFINKFKIIIQYYQQMYKLWRREVSKPSTSDQNIKRKEAQMMQNLSQTIKNIRKKQQFYLKALFLQKQFAIQSIKSITSQKTLASQIVSNGRQHTSSGIMTSQINDRQRFDRPLQIHELQNQLQSLLTQQQQLMSSIKNFQTESFFLNKTYLYTVLVRLLQILDFARQRVTIKVKNNQKIFNNHWQKLYEDNKQAVTQCYQNLIYFQNFNVLQLLSTSNKKQNNRIWSMVPLKARKNHVTLMPIVRLNSTQPKKSFSIEVKPKKQDIAQLINKKLLLKQKKLQDEKKAEQKKKIKQFPIIMKQLYGILAIRIPKIEEGNAFVKQMQQNALQRNEIIIQQRKKWQKKCQQKYNSNKIVQQII